MVAVYDVIVTSSDIRFSGIESCEKREISGLDHGELPKLHIISIY